MSKKIRIRQCADLIQQAMNQGDLDRYYANDSFAFDKALIDFTKKWIERYITTKESNAMEKFIYIWVTFNAWGTLAVPDRTRNHIDAYLIHSIAKDKGFQDRFDRLLHDNKKFKENGEELRSLCPIIKVLWMRNHGIPEWDYKNDGETREQFIRRVRLEDPFDVNRNGKRVPAFAPICSFDNHVDKNQPIPLDWPHTLHAIYQIRCNLFHGGKNYNSEKDVHFVELAHEILWEMWSPELPASLFS